MSVSFFVVAIYYREVKLRKRSELTHSLMALKLPVEAQLTTRTNYRYELNAQSAWLVFSIIRLFTGTQICQVVSDLPSDIRVLGFRR